MPESSTNTANAWNVHNRSYPSSSQDPSNPYYVHPSDANSSQLVSLKFSGTGFSNWKRSMLLSLSAKNKLGFLDGSIAKPIGDSHDLKAWERCNDLVCSWILNSLDENISKSVLFFKTAQEIWSDLDDRFGYASMTQVYALEQQLSEMNQGSKSVSEFFTEIKTLWDAMSDASPLPHCTCNKCTCNVTQRVHQMQQDHRLLQFMMKLSDKFSAIRGNVLMQQPLPTLSNAFRLFSQEERHQQIAGAGVNTETMAFMADTKKGNFKSSYTGNSQKTAYGSNNGKTSNPSTGAKKGSNYYCTNCKIQGHSLERCFKVHGYPPGFKNFKDKRVAATTTTENFSDANTPISQAQYHQLLELLNKQHLNSGGSQSTTSSDHAMLAGKFCLLADNESKSRWLIDSGATDHICSDISYFSSVKRVDYDEFITIPDGSKVKIQHIGAVKLKDNMILENVLHVPSLKFNLLSVHRLCKDLNYQMLFTENGCFLQDPLQKKRQIALGNIEDGLYTTQTADHKRQFASICCAATTDSTTWHLRLGHTPFSTLKLVPTLSHLKDNSKEVICTVCPQAKQTRFSFPHSTIKTKAVFELLHMDIWDPTRLSHILDVLCF